MKVLMISPTPSHPQDAGNRTRIFRLADELRSLGCDLFLLYYAMEDADYEAMREYWGDRLCILLGSARTLRRRVRRDDLRAGFKNRLRGFGIGGSLTSPGPKDVDAWCGPDLEEAVRRLHLIHDFRVIWIEYVFLSRILCGFDSSVLKVIDTHDVFSRRYAMMRSREMDPEWFYTTPEMEKKGLARADRVVAIHEKDAASFRALGLPRVVTVGHFARVRPAPGISPRNRILFVGSHNSGNLKAWDYFMNRILGLIEKRLPEISIRLAGRICQRIPEDPRYEKLGRVEDLGPLYASSTLAVNPEIGGTGLKIKTLEPLAYGCPVVTTPAGIQGVEEAENRGILVGRTPGEFAECVERLMTRPSFREEQGRSARGFMRDYLQQNRLGLADLLAEAESPKLRRCPP
jgi:polysaccharide biosynthesis protein PslH